MANDTLRLATTARNRTVSRQPADNLTVREFNVGQRRNAQQLAADDKLRVLLYIRSRPWGKRVPAIRKIAADLGVGQRTVYNWLERYRAYGLPGLARFTRADRGVPRALDGEILARIDAAVANRAHRSIRSEWRRLGMPGCYETFRYAFRLAELRHGVAPGGPRAIAG